MGVRAAPRARVRRRRPMSTTVEKFPGQLTEVGVKLPARMTRDALIAAAKHARRLSTATPWVAADILLYAEAHFGEEAAQISEELELPPQTRANYLWVGRVFPLARRRGAPMTFAHHAPLAKLTPADQDAWLDLAEKGDG